ncbi:MAG: ABC transporter ATP-binding protein [Phototrophicaceae bacterium]
MIEVENLVKQYGDFIAVKGVTFSAKPGEVTGFLGPNGAGKTTTMRILAGYLPPTSGRAMVAGQNVFENSLAVRQHVGYLPESVPLYRDMTPLGYLTYVGEIRGVSNLQARALQSLERVGLAQRAYNRIRNLSKGMKQRVGLASVLLHDPQVIILDEPTIGLDPLQVEELRSLIRELGKSHTVLFSTHILSEAEAVCDNIVIINQGEIVAKGSPANLRSQLESGGRILIRLDGMDSGDTRETARLTLEKLHEISQVVISDEMLIATPAHDDIDPRPVIARTVIEHGWDLIELRALAVDLEEIFLEVTRRTTNKQGAN